jgi:hypothetical protein
VLLAQRESSLFTPIAEPGSEGRRRPMDARRRRGVLTSLKADALGSAKARVVARAHLVAFGAWHSGAPVPLPGGSGGLPAAIKRLYLTPPPGPEPRGPFRVRLPARRGTCTSPGYRPARPAPRT